MTLNYQANNHNILGQLLCAKINNYKIIYIAVCKFTIALNIRISLFYTHSNAIKRKNLVV